MTSSRPRSWCVVLAALASVVAPPSAGATCPQVVCDCLGQAAQYDVVGAAEVSMKHITYVDEGAAVKAGSNAAAVCTTTGTLKGTLAGLGDGTTSAGTFVALAGPGLEAIRASSQGSGIAVFMNLLATGGATFTDTDEAEVNQLDTSGTHAQVSACTQAMADVQTASQTLAALTPTLEYEDIVLTGDDEFDINAGPGVNVIKAGKIVLRSTPAFNGATLRINTVPGTESVIINTDQLSVGYACGIQAGSNTIINVAGAGSPVRLGRYPRVDPLILAPERIVKIVQAFSPFQPSGVYARSVSMRGSGQSPACP
jgi:hypothetical protein